MQDKPSVLLFRFSFARIPAPYRKEPSTMLLDSHLETISNSLFHHPRKRKIQLRNRKQRIRHRHARQPKNALRQPTQMFHPVSNHVERTI